MKHSVKKTVFNIVRDMYYMLSALVVKTAALNKSGIDSLSAMMGGLRYRYGYVGFHHGRQFFTDMISRANPELTGDQVQRTLKGFWCNHQRFFFELFLFMNLDEHQVSGNIRFTGLHHLDNALSHGKGTILFVPHMGNERLIHLALALKDYPVAVITGDFRDAGPYVQKVKLQTTRKFHPLFFPDDPPRKYLRFITDNNGVLQVSPPAEPLKKETLITFLNHEIPVSHSAFRIARQADAPVVPALCVRQKNTFEICMRDPLYPDDGIPRTYDYKTELTDIYQWIESYVQKYPDQFNWIWLATKISHNQELLNYA